MPRPRSLTPPQIAAAALAVIDRDGLAALSMRAVAHELGMSTMALYRYVEDREQLEAQIVELVLGGVDTAPPPGLAWSEQVTVLIERVRDAVAAHPEVVPLTVRHRHASAAILRWSETVLTVLTTAGLDGGRRVIALRGLLSYLIGAIQLEHIGPLSGADTETMAGLPGTHFPVLAETARRARQVTPDQEFRGGLALLLRGIHAEVPAGPRQAAPDDRDPGSGTAST